MGIQIRQIWVEDVQARSSKSAQRTVKPLRGTPHKENGGFGGLDSFRLHSGIRNLLSLLIGFVPAALWNLESGIGSLLFGFFPALLWNLESGIGSLPLQPFSEEP